MSSARKNGDRDHLDRFYTNTVLAEAIVAELPESLGKDSRGVWEPHVGGGAFAMAVQRRWPKARVRVSDIDPTAPALRDLGGTCSDFLSMSPKSKPWLIIGNPPYGEAEAHVRHALEQTRGHVVFLLRLAFLESAARVGFWASSPLRKVWVLAERPSFTSDGKTDSCAYMAAWWSHTYKGEPQICPGWSWVHHRQPSLFGGAS